jgi:nucleoside-diphosphate-sugar epimerase
VRVLVTGATGLLGGALALRLAAEGIAVRALVRRSADVRQLHGGGVELAFGDVRELATVQDAMRGCSHVVHLAAAKTIHNVPRAEYHTVNVRGTRNLTDAARTEGVTRFVYGGAIGVHGFVAGRSLNESSPARPNTPYRLTKWMAENVVQDAHRREGLPSVVARITSAVGRDAKGWLPFARAIQENRLRLIGDGTNQIDLVAVADLVDGLWQCATVPGVEGRVYLLGSSQPQTVGTFAAEIARRLGSRAPRRGLPAGPYRVLMHAASVVFRTTGYYFPFAHGREMLVADRHVSIARARADLGYDPRRPLSAAIDEMIGQFIGDGLLPARGAY